MKTAPVLLAAVALLATAAQPAFADPGYRYGGEHWDRGEDHYRYRGFRDCDDGGYRRDVDRHYYYRRYGEHPVYYSQPSYHYYYYDRDDDYRRNHHHGGDHDLGLLAIIGGAVLVDQILLDR